ncbi:hypothetical protein [Streptomyces sp. NBC_01618]|uniref:hypothetical protein n=1 Tax=Streptomyces sp. NBC_01618 TaxID=2975900 RepID=UPI00386E974F|nr:hypothetical protein OH735_31985 [Streptomyces sp. NBC_01618]
MTSGVIFAWSTPKEGHEQAFHDWYDNEHIPSRVDLPGIEGARRYSNVKPGETAQFAVRYDVSDTAVFDSAEFKELRTNPSEESRRVIKNTVDFDRFVGEEIITQGNTWHPIDVTISYVVTFTVPEDYWNEFEAWYATEHLPIMLQEPLWAGCQIYRCIKSDRGSGAPGNQARDSWTHVAFHSLRSQDAMKSPARERARATPWRERLSQNAWHRASVRHTFEAMTQPSHGA